jgi:uncharacterized repeat protein (TIGR03803 family)
MRQNGCLFSWLTCGLAAASIAQAQPTESVILSFASFPRGASPYAPLTRDSSGNLYGTTNQGGQSNAGLVFEVDSSGTQAVLYNFTGGADGGSPYAGVIRSSGGEIFGTAYQGGAANAGVVYKLDPYGKETVLHSFTGGADGGNPYAGVVFDTEGNLYGTTYNGGASGAGVVYKITPSGQETVLYSFTGGTDGSNPYAGVIFGDDGYLYGTTLHGGLVGYYATGVIYKLSVSGQETVLYTFNGAAGGGPAVPYSGVVRDAAGNLYGASYSGDSGKGSNHGTVYELEATGAMKVLYSFKDGGPTEPKGNLIQDPAGNLYGTTEYAGEYDGGSGVGAVYKLDTAGNFTILYQFPGSQVNATAAYPNAGVIRDSEGNLYGTTPYGGLKGMVYKLDAAGQETTLYSFPGAAGGTTPFAGVTLGSAGSLYGTTQLGGASNWGAVYRVNAAGRETALYNFSGGADGAFPESSVVLDDAGNAYGTATGGGSAPGTAGFGVVFKISSAGQETVLYTFKNGADGARPGGVILGSAGELYGNAGGGAAGGGVVFKLDPSGTQTVLCSFTGGKDGGGPGDIIMDSAGNIYGTTYSGGASGLGVVYELDTSGRETVLYSFPGGPDGAVGGANLFRDSAGNLYGTTWAGGGSVDEAGSGVVFELDAAGNYAVLYRFTGGADGGTPFAGVIRDPSGNLYGTTNEGGTSGDCTGGCGVVYKISASGEEIVLHSFTGGADGSSPSAGLAFGSAGGLFGTTPWGGKGATATAPFSGAGVVYEIAPQ